MTIPEILGLAGIIALGFALVAVVALTEHTEAVAHQLLAAAEPDYDAHYRDGLTRQGEPK